MFLFLQIEPDVTDFRSISNCFSMEIIIIILFLILGLSQALGTSKKESAADFSSSKLSKVTQLTGFSDPVYAEAYVHVHQYDIVLDVLIVNQVTI